MTTNPNAVLGREEAASQLSWALEQVAREQGVGLDPLALLAAVEHLDGRHPLADLKSALQALGYAAPRAILVPDRARLPLVAWTQAMGWLVVIGGEPDGRWQVASADGTELVSHDALAGACMAISWERHSETEMTRPGDVGGGDTFSAVLRRTLRLYRGSLMEAVLASIFIGALALMTSLFSMQVYDRVIPTRGEYTLVVLGVGVMLSIVIEMALKFVRSHIMDYVSVGLDNRLSREVFQRLLRLRVDQLPTSVGSLAGQMRGYEQVRNFYTASTLFALVDVPMGLFFLLVIGVIASPFVALLPLVLAVLSVVIGIVARRKVGQFAEAGAGLANRKTGLLVEAVEGVETIKSGSGGWKFLARWLHLNSSTIGNDLKIRRSSEGSMYYAAALQQISYAGVVVVGALVVMKGDMTMGALIASSILCGRVLSPVMMLPGLFVQHAHAKAALKGLDQLYTLKTDNDGLERVLIPSQLRGHFHAEALKFGYGNNPPALDIESLDIREGERVGIMGPIGSGKSTLLRMLSGMYTPNSGRIFIDDLDLSHVSRDVINRHVGYLQQEHRLFQGSLRENLLIGLPDPGDDALWAAMRRTGMDRLVRAHPQGLERPISEGGRGLSGGQRQLVAFTRLILTNPQVLLLDEPTANMDQMQERQCVAVLKEEAAAGKGMVIVTHKVDILPLVDRILIIIGNKIVVDGPREEVLRRFQSGEPLVSPPKPTLAVASVVASIQRKAAP